MAKLSLNPEPTFEAAVNIHVPGKKPVPVKFTFKHRTRLGVKELWDEIKDGKFDGDDAAMVMALAKGWELDDEYTADNVRLLVDSYAGAAGAILDTYFRELAGAREGN